MEQVWFDDILNCRCSSCLSRLFSTFSRSVVKSCENGSSEECNGSFMTVCAFMQFCLPGLEEVRDMREEEMKSMKGKWKERGGERSRKKKETGRRQ